MHPIRLVSSLAALAVCCFTSIVDAQQTTGQAPGNAQANTARPGPVRALLITGGCCHDYDRQKLIIPKGVSARADVVWTVVQQGGTVTDSKIPLYEDPNWADGFDVIVHNECFADVKDQAWVERILKPHREGKPAVLIHCAMHCYRTGNDSWFEFCGVQSPGHGPHYAYTVTNQSPNHPIMKGFGPQWSVPKGELYDTIKLFPTATPLATAPRQSDNQPQTCIWTNNYHGTRVFATTIGHYNETMAQPQYLDFLTRGILWAVHGDQAPELKSVSEEQNQQVMALVSADTKANTAVPESRCCQEGNLAYQQTTSASSEETGKENFAKKAVDGDLSTRWCASGGSPGEWLQIDLASEQAIGGIRLHWEQPNNAYKYRIEGSTDAQSWQVLVDQSENKKNRRVVSHETDPAKTKARYIKITYLGSKSGGWGSLFEVEVAKDKLPELPAGSDALKAEVATLADVKAPAGFEVRMFAAPPQVSYPVCLTAAATGEVFVGIDEQGSLGKEKGRGQIVRCFDRDGDGVADEVNTFAKIDHPRGLVYDQGSLWVLHPPYLTLLKDNDLDGVADEQRVLIDGISTDQVAARGADHTTNGIRMGIDGWIYIAVGDYGFLNAKGTDGRVMSRRGGGIVRVRPDGAEMEVYSWGQRNILDACIDPYLNIFTRDNTNDGGGWDIRVTHILQGAHYGYPSKYINYPEETMPPLGQYGGGSGCGGMYFFDNRWPAKYASAALTCDWGTSRVYAHQGEAVGATFAPSQEVFLELPRPTDIDVDGSGRMYVSSWKNGGFNFSDPNVGFVAQVVPQGFVAKPFPDVTKLSDDDLIKWLATGNSVPALAVQREILRRGASGSLPSKLQTLIAQDAAPLAGRVAAIFTYKQLLGHTANDFLTKQARTNSSIRRYAMRALTDRLNQLDQVDQSLFVSGLSDSDAAVQAQALISLTQLARAGKLADRAAIAGLVLPLAVVRDPDGNARTTPVAHHLADPARVVPHLATVALREMKAGSECVQALKSEYRTSAELALREMHDPAVIEGLNQLIETDPTNASLKQVVYGLLGRLYFREGDYVKSDWWGTRPDTTGPYYDRKTWEASDRIKAILERGLKQESTELVASIEATMKKYQIKSESSGTSKAMPAKEQAIVIRKPDPNNPNQIGNMKVELVREKSLKTPGDKEKGKALFTSQSCIQCHTDSSGQTPKGPHLVDIGKRYQRTELIDSILTPNAKIAQGFDSWTILTNEGQVYNGFVVLESAETLTIRQNNGLAVEIPQDNIEERKKQETSMMPTGLVDALTPTELSDLLAYLESLH